MAEAKFGASVVIKINSEVLKVPNVLSVKVEMDSERGREGLDRKHRLAGHKRERSGAGHCHEAAREGSGRSPPTASSRSRGG